MLANTRSLLAATKCMQRKILRDVKHAYVHINNWHSHTAQLQ